MKSTSFSAALICRKNETGKLEFLILPSYRVRTSRIDGKRARFGEIIYKFPGGRSHGEIKESPWKNCRRETKEETGLIIYVVACIHRIEIETEPGHIQHYYLVDGQNVKGKLRTRNKKDKKSDLLPPVWMKEGQLLESMLFPTHLRAYRFFKELGLI